MGTPLGVVHKSLSTLLYEQLREEIIDGRLPPGTKLVEQALAERFVVSRVPLREALPLLESEGFVTSIPRRGTFVVQLTRRDVEELYDAREGLESTAARLAARRVKRDGQGVVARLARVLEEAKASTSDSELAILSTEFHREVVIASDNQLMVRLMKPIIGRAMWLTRLTLAQDSALATESHSRLLEMIKMGDEDGAYELAQQHIASGRANSLAIVESLFTD